jgi:tetratricopeptide (TPR) repeat protein
MGLFDRFKPDTAAQKGLTAKEWCDNGRAALNTLGRPQEALQCFDNALKLDPKDADAWVGKGTALMALGRNQEAIPCFDKALDLDPQLGRTTGLRFAN